MSVATSGTDLPVQSTTAKCGASSQMQTSLERLNTEACPRLKQQKHAGRTAPPASMECDGKALEELDQKDLVEFVDL
jgi:hypothetical protein